MTVLKSQSKICLNRINFQRGAGDSIEDSGVIPKITETDFMWIKNVKIGVFNVDDVVEIVVE